MKRNDGVAHIKQGVYWNEAYPFLHVRSTFSSNHPYATHFHDCLSLGVVFKGETELRCNGVASKIEAGQMVLIAPMKPHSCNPLGDHTRGYHMFSIDSEWALTTLDATPGSRLTVKKSIIDDGELFDAMMRLALAIRKGKTNPHGCAALANAVRANCGFCPASGEPASMVFSLWADEGNVVGKEALSVGESARELGIRRESFIRSFQRASGMTPVKYRQRLRLIRAREMLHQERSLVETALACGYTDQSHFHRMCVKYLSATPVQMKSQKSLSYKK